MGSISNLSRISKTFSIDIFTSTTNSNLRNICQLFQSPFNIIQNLVTLLVRTYLKISVFQLKGKIFVIHSKITMGYHFFSNRIRTITNLGNQSNRSLEQPEGLTGLRNMQLETFDPNSKHVNLSAQPVRDYFLIAPNLEHEGNKDFIYSRFTIVWLGKIDFSSALFDSALQ